MYLWKMVLSNNKVKFDFTEHTPEKATPSRVALDYFDTDCTYSQDDAEIKPIVDATFKLADALNLDLNKNYILAIRAFSRFLFIYGAGIFEARLVNGNIVLRTVNYQFFTQEQFIAMFDFLNTLKETNWFF